MPDYSQRIARVQEVLRSNGLGGAVFAPSDQMRYLTGWAEYGHERLVALFVPSQGDPEFVVPTMNASQARDNAAGISRVRGWEDETGWHVTVKELLGMWHLNGHGLAVDDELYSVHLMGIQSLAPGTPCVPALDLMATLRELKSAEELELMDKSGAVTDAVYEECVTQLRAGMTELEFQDRISLAYKARGTRPAFALVCFGANSAIPHHHVGNTRLNAGDVVIMDIGCVLDDYASDITRTVAFGEPDPEAKYVYEVVSRAHQAAFDIAKPGVSCEVVDKAARDVIDDAGFGDQFIHRTGHGIGLSTHEPPYIVKGNKQELLPGMCFSDEPGIYLPGRFGVRIENIVTVTDTGVRYMNAMPADHLLVV
jgi:Xaa-Pro aminopeptidase